MDQIVRKPSPETTIAIEAALGLDSQGPPEAAQPAALALRACRDRSARRRQPAAIPGCRRSRRKIVYNTVPAAKDGLTVTVSATGTLQPLTQVDISSELSGVVRTVAVDENDLVHKGDVLAELDTTRLAAQVEGAEASAKAADARVDDARTTLKESEQALARQQQLSTRGMVADQALETATATRDRAASAVKIAEANLAIAEAELKQRQTDVEKSTIYAPIDGIVLTRSVDPGQTVASSLQAPVLFVIAADLKSMELKAAIDEADIGGVAPGQKARFTRRRLPRPQLRRADPRHLLRLGHHRRRRHL